jgi:hypothetical protein
VGAPVAKVVEHALVSNDHRSRAAGSPAAYALEGSGDKGVIVDLDGQSGDPRVE